MTLVHPLLKHQGIALSNGASLCNRRGHLTSVAMFVAAALSKLPQPVYLSTSRLLLLSLLFLLLVLV
jgi:hypothetical protein